MLRRILSKIIGDPNEKFIKSLQSTVDLINEFELQYQKDLKDENFVDKTNEFKKRILDGQSIDDILPEAFALVKNACRRLNGKSWKVRDREKVWDMVPYDVQLIGGITLHQGKIAEMKTGEGKTLVATLPLYLNSLSGKGAFLVTVNDYLAHRDREWMTGLFEFLGLTTGVIFNGQNPAEKKAAYNADITYGTNNEFGFDYLRDNMAGTMEEIVQRNLHYAIVDEVDSILIDEARTPLIISASAEQSTEKYNVYCELVKKLKEDADYNIDEKQRVVTLTEEGISKMEKFLGVENIYTEKGFEEVNHIEQALKAHAIFKIDIDYVVRDGEVMIVDEFTGRLMPGRRFSSGLHQAIEAKEKVIVKRESKTLATISFQNYFRLFDKLAGMTGTALTEAEEFAKIYNLETVVIPTNQPVARVDLHDAIYKHQKAKFQAIAKKVKNIYEKGQPVLIGTVSIEKSEKLSEALQTAGISHTVLNAKYHEKEAEIIAKAGEKFAVTIATNMAGRGTDIKLAEGVKELGGLYIIGTERHESRRIDNQLRGRSGRQGDSGFSQFYVSMDDDIMRIFGGDRIRQIMDTLNIPDDMPIENGIISRSIEGAQKKVEGYNFDLRNHLVEYDDVMNHHREIIYGKRKQILKEENIKNEIIILIEKEAEAIILAHTIGKHVKDFDYKEISESVNAVSTLTDNKLDFEHIAKLQDTEALIEAVKNHFFQNYEIKEKEIPDFTEQNGSRALREIERMIFLRVLDSLWMTHITEMSDLRSSVSLSGYGQRDPLVVYKTEAYHLFDKLQQNIQSQVVNGIFKANIIDKTAAEKLKMIQQKFMTNEESISGSTMGQIKLIKANEPRKSDNGAMPSIGRNDPCPCGSGKKYKKCCTL